METTATGRPGTWTEYALERLDRAGYRRGGSRRKVIDYLASRECATTAPDIDRELDRVGRASVYRTLEQLEELGLVQRVDLGGESAAYERVDPTGNHHHHLVCTTCGKVVPFEDSGLERAIHAVNTSDGFEVEAHEVTLRGTCERCR